MTDNSGDEYVFYYEVQAKIRQMIETIDKMLEKTKSDDLLLLTFIIEPYRIDEFDKSKLQEKLIHLGETLSFMIKRLEGDP